MRLKSSLRSVALIMFAAAASCGANITISKAKEGSKGYRYYLPRPFLAVKKEFPWSSSDDYVEGTVQSIGGVLFLVIDDPKQVKALGTDSASLPMTSLRYKPAAGSAPAKPSGLHGDSGKKQ